MKPLYCPIECNFYTLYVPQRNRHIFFFLLSAYFVALHFELNICYKINVFLTCASLIVKIVNFF